MLVLIRKCVNFLKISYPYISSSTSANTWNFHLTICACFSISAPVCKSYLLSANIRVRFVIWCTRVPSSLEIFYYSSRKFVFIWENFQFDIEGNEKEEEKRGEKTTVSRERENFIRLHALFYELFILNSSSSLPI